MSESRPERFKRLANHRTNEVLKKLRILGNLSNRTNYDYSQEEINKIFSAIDSQLRIVKIKFTGGTKKEFKL